MREIKFRQWDYRYKKMITGAEIVSDGHFRGFSLLNFNENIPMQYTGLKDKNSKEIYEGDIVKIYQGHKDHLTSLFEIIFYDGAFCLKKANQTIEEQKPTSIIKYGDDCFSNGFGLEVGAYIKVIGNIYENPELKEVL